MTFKEFKDEIFSWQTPTWNWSVAFLLVSNRNKDTKYGSIANKSIMFKPPLKNFHLSGDAPNLSIYSSVNHVMQTPSTMANSGLSMGTPSLKCCRDGNVFSVRPMVDKIMNNIDITAITCNDFWFANTSVFFSFYLQWAKLNINRKLWLFMYFFVCL